MVSCQGRFDTGTSLSAISPNIVDGLALEPAGVVQAARPGESHEDEQVYQTYDVELHIWSEDGQLVPFRSEATGIDPAGPYDVLIGMDVISAGVLTVGPDWLLFEVEVEVAEPP